jgi:two-component system OmpR family sensor kinase
MRLPTTALSIRFRLVLGMVLLVSVGLAVANVSGVVLMRSYLLDRVDNQVGSITPATGDTPLPGAPSDLCANPRDPRGLRSDFLLLVLDADGEVACSLGPALGEAAPSLDQSNLTGTDELVTVASRDGTSRWRVRAVQLENSGQTLVTAVSLADADATVSRLTWLSLLVSGLVLLLTGAAAWVIARVGLQPLKRIEETAERIADGDLSERVPTYRRRTEVGRLAHSLNGMLVQIERAFSARTESEARLRRFVSDASHELRTPVAAIRGHAELWRTGVSRDLDTVMSRIESESTRMGDLVDDLLLLARLDQARPLQRVPVDLLSLATDAVIDTQALQPGRLVTLDAEPGTRPPVVTGDEARLRQVMANLLTNALAHTPPTSPIAVSVQAREHDVEVSVSDSGPGMSPEVLDKVFDRFYRADPARTRDHGGTGLGLAIVKSLTEAHGGTVTCSSNVTQGSTFVVTLPLAAGAS